MNRDYLPPGTFEACGNCPLPRACVVPFFSVLLLVSATVAWGQSAHARFPVTDGPVRALHVSGSTLYVGGDFKLIGPPTGSGVPVDAVSGMPAGSYPEVHGTIDAVVPDGYGGWFIGGAFDRVGPEPRSNLAHINANLNVSLWDPGSNAPVHALAIDGQTVYAGGEFTRIGGFARSHVAALSAATGRPQAWHIEVDSTVHALVATGGRVYLGGSFQSVNGVARRNLAEVDEVTAAVGGWNPDPDGRVLGVAAADGVVYAGGEFTHASGITRRYIVAIDAGTGVITPWNGTCDGIVHAVAVSGGKVYLGGEFMTAGGQRRVRLAALSTRWYQAVPWAATIDCEFSDGTLHACCAVDATIRTIVVSGAQVFIGGDFTHINYLTRYRVAVLDTTIGAVADWSPRVDGAVRAIATSGGGPVYLGGAFLSVGGEARSQLAAIDLASDRVTSWNPANADPVGAITVSAGVVHAAMEYYGAASFDSVTGAVVHRYPIGPAAVAVAAGGSQQRLFLGTSHSPFPNVSIMAVDPNDGSELWTRNTQFNMGYVNALLESGGRLFVTGRFDSLGQKFVMLESATGRVLKASSVEGYALCPGDSSLYIATFQNIQSMSLATGDILPWSVITGYASCLAWSNGRLYAGGNFTSVAGQPRNRLAAIDVSQAIPTPWHPDVDRAVFALAAAGRTIYVGGEFTSVSGDRHSYLAAINDDGPPIAAVSPGRMPEGLELGAATPNPFTASTRVSFDLPRDSRASLEMLDVTGRRVRWVLEGHVLAAGHHEIVLQSRHLQAGVYWLRLAVDRQSSSRRIVVLSE